MKAKNWLVSQTLTSSSKELTVFSSFKWAWKPSIAIKEEWVFCFHYLYLWWKTQNLHILHSFFHDLLSKASNAQTPALPEIFKVLHYLQADSHWNCWSPDIFDIPDILWIEAQYFPNKSMSDHIQWTLKPSSRELDMTLWGAGGRCE